MRHSMGRAMCATMVLAVLLGGCGDSGTDAQALPKCDGSVSSLTVSAGTTPTFRWSPECRLGGLTVARASDDKLMWAIQSTRYNMPPGVRYGRVPNGMEETHDAEPLVPGTTYVVDIIPPPGPGLVPVFGRTQFTP